MLPSNPSKTHRFGVVDSKPVEAQDNRAVVGGRIVGFVRTCRVVVDTIVVGSRVVDGSRRMMRRPWFFLVFVCFWLFRGEFECYVEFFDSVFVCC